MPTNVSPEKMHQRQKAQPSFISKWWTYQRERFPVIAHGILIAAFSFSAVSFSALLRGSHHLPAPAALAVAFVNSFLAFLQLRIADEFKDFDEDSRYRPYRPVPRGLITLRELRNLGILTAIIQLSLAAWLNLGLIPLLLITWTYLALMSHEFFVRDWLKQRRITYLWTHMLIMPLIDFYATACDWRPLQSHVPAGLFWFVIVSFFNGIVIEFGRKIRAPELEEHGVNTYTALWGRPRAIGAWLFAMTATAVSASSASRLIGFFQPATITLAIGLSVAATVAILFLRNPSPKWSKLIEPISGLWTLTMYLILGAIPLLLKVFRP